jgi:hypothetical protein
MKNILLFIVLIANNIFAQKKVEYLNFESIQITKEKFDSIYNSRLSIIQPLIFITQIDNDSITTYKLNSSLFVRKLNIEEQNTVVDYLSKLAKIELNKDKNIILEYFPTKNSCVQNLGRGKLELGKIIKKREDSNELIYLVQKNNHNNYDKNLVKKDKDNFFYKRYINLDLGCVNFFIFKPNGDCYILLGENRYQTVLDILEK